MANKREKKQRSNNQMRQPYWLIRILGGAFVVTALITAILAFRFAREIFSTTNVFQLPGVSIQDGGEQPGDDVDSDSSNYPSAPVINVEEVEVDFTSRINILVMGLDYRDWLADDGPARTDTMILVTIDPVAKTAGMLSIPRDLWVNVPGYGQNKINTAYFLGEGNRLPEGGPGLAAKTVEEFLGVDVHYWAQVDFTAFVQFVDYIGGIKMEITETIVLEMIGGEKEKIKPGRYTFDGALALAFARNRSEGDGDFDRARRQQQVILAIRRQLLRADVQKILLSNPKGVWDIFSAGIKTNVPFDAAFRLGMLALKINPEQITQKVIAPPEHVTHALSPEGLSILKPITQNIRILRDEIFTPVGLIGPAAADGDPLDLLLAEAAKVGVYNGSSVSGLAGATEQYLLGKSVNVTQIGNMDYVPSTTIYDYTGNPYTVRYFVELMGIQQTRIFNSYDPNSTIDVAIILGNEWQVPEN
jgi:LCP family protein required for cell wall assembly